MHPPRLQQLLQLRLRLLVLSLLAASWSWSWTVVAADSKPAVQKPCTIHSPSTGSFIDLRPLQIIATSAGGGSSGSGGGSGSSAHSNSHYYSISSSKSQPGVGNNVSYRARGYDYPYNFTLNFCGPVVEKVENVDGVLPRSRWANISAYYHDDKTDTTYSLGQENHELVFRGRKLLTNYTMGSPCPDLDEDGEPIPATAAAADLHKPGKAAAAATRRKNTMISFVCDSSPTLSGRPAVAFLGTPDHCTYVFEVRSRYACGGTTSSDEKGTLGPGAVFLVILAIALLVYVIGGIVYRRNVMHQRGWKQIPNYEVWSAITTFISDITIILLSSCAQSLPSLGRLFGGRRGGGYHRVGTDEHGNSIGGGGGPGGDISTSRRRGGLGLGGGHGAGAGSTGSAGAGRDRDPEAENRLIDSYDEEWEN